MEEVDWLTETDRCDVIICARPESIDVLDLPSVVEDRGEELTLADQSEDARHAVHPDFHDQLKAAALRTTVPLQLIRPESWNDKNRPPHGVQRRKVQDPATRAWNLHTALYYKAGGTPWRLIRSFADVTMPETFCGSLWPLIDRSIIHKTSRFTESERTGFTNAADALIIDRLELIWVTDREPARLFRPGEHPPLRSTAFQISDDRFVVYTGGSVEF
jgi:hypothetical protein